MNEKILSCALNRAFDEDPALLKLIYEESEKGWMNYVLRSKLCDRLAQLVQKEQVAVQQEILK
jgi:hypothetical protein